MVDSVISLAISPLSTIDECNGACYKRCRCAEVSQWDESKRLVENPVFVDADAAHRLVADGATDGGHCKDSSKDWEGFDRHCSVVMFLGGAVQWLTA
jgi:hypothetical protein